MSLIAELKRRNVFKVGAAYLALAWLVLQLTSIVVPAFELPAWTLKFVIWFGVIGFPCVLVFAWIYELTPEGLKRDSDVEPGKSITGQTGRKLDYVIIALLVLAIGLFVLQYFRPPAAEVAPTAAIEVVATPAMSPAVQAESLAVPQPVEAIAPDDKSIAVLPFVNMSSDKEQEYFSDGMSEELLNLLAKVPELKVIARTSSFAFKGTNTPIAEIAKQLNVAHVLEGSVRKAGNTVRITTQLIRAADSVHLWSETYDRELSDVFAMQDEIAGAVVNQLKITLFGSAPGTRSTNTEAYTLYLSARQLSRIGTTQSYEESNALYKKALNLDPAFAEAWDGLAENYIYMAIEGSMPRNEGRRLADDALAQALSRNPELVAAHRHRGKLAMIFDSDHKSASEHYTHALQLAAGDNDTLRESAQLLMALGNTERAIWVLRYVISQDPLNPLGHYLLGVTCGLGGRFVESVDSMNNALHVVPNYSGARAGIAQALLEMGDREGALTAIRAESSLEWRRPFLPYILYRLDRTEEGDAALQELKANPIGWDVLVAAAEAARGDIDAAFEWLERAAARREIALFEVPYEPALKGLHDDPRWLPFLRKIGMAPEQLAAIKFDVKLPQQ